MSLVFIYGKYVYSEDLCEERMRIIFKLNGNKGCIFLNFD